MALGKLLKFNYLLDYQKEFIMIYIIADFNFYLK